MSLLESLFRLMLASPERGLDARDVRTIREADSPAFEAALTALGPHKVFPLLAHQLTQFELAAALPHAVRSRLDATAREVRTLGVMYLLSAATILRLAAQRGERIVALKGLLLADGYYPDFATRPMGDIDLLAAPGRAEALFDILRTAGFHEAASQTPQEDGVAYENRQGIKCDAHRTLRMFEGERFDELVVATSFSRVRGVTLFALEPNALLAHLAAHMDGHFDDLGLVLLWVLDLAFVFRRVGAVLELGRVRALLGSERRYALLLRSVRMLELAGERLPKAWTHAARFVPPLSIAFVLRSRRVVPWGIPSLRGFIRVAAHTTVLEPPEARPLPTLEDLLCWPLDALSTRVAPHLVL